MPIHLKNFSQQGGGNLEGRFGGDEQPQVSGSTTTFSGQDGKFTQTSHTLGSDGKWHSNTNKGAFNG